MEKFAVFTTEKPSVAQEYKAVLQVEQKERTNGYIKGFSPVLNKNVVITWCVGHLCTLSYPEKYSEDLASWSFDTLPFLPEKYLYEVIDNTKDQYKVVKSIYQSPGCEEIYYAGDSGREGLYIQMLVRQLTEVRDSVKQRVIWIDSFTEAEILKGIREAKPVEDYQNLSNAAYMRAIEDYSVGINFSRALSLRFGNYFKAKAGAQKAVIAVGRVMTCVLGMVTAREREIRAFEEKPFYKVIAKIGDLEAEWRTCEKSKYQSPEILYGENGFWQRNYAEELLRSCEPDKSLLIEDLKISTEKKKAPLLFNLAEIQFFCSKKYKMSPDDTLAIIQSLYEKKLVTYPRTDARVLSSAVASEIKVNLSGLVKVGYKKDKLREIAANKWHESLLSSAYVDDKKITDHYAIIPTGAHAGVDNLSDMETKIFHDIIDRFLCIFYPPAEYKKIEAIFKHSTNEWFFLSKKTLSKRGYLEVLDEGKIEENPLIGLSKGEQVSANFFVKEGATTPPKRYSSGSIIIAMENAGKMIDDEELREQIKGSGIGTSATRAAIIQKLTKIDYLALDKKTQILTPTAKGECVYDIVNETIPEFLKPNMTASWEKGLSGIEEGSVTKTDYQAKLEDYVRTSVAKIKNSESENATYYVDTSTDYVCPCCKEGKLRDLRNFYGCSRYKEGCDFKLWTTVAGKKLSASHVEALLTKGRTGLIKGFVSKNKKKFDARLKLSSDGKISFVFEDAEE